MTEYIIELAAHNAGAAMALCDGVHEKIVRCRDCKWFTPNTSIWKNSNTACSRRSSRLLIAATRSGAATTMTACRGRWFPCIS